MTSHQDISDKEQRAHERIHESAYREHRELPELDPTQQTRDWIDIKLGGLRSEMRLLFVISVAGNQLLSHITLSPVVGYVGSAAVVVAGAAKIALLR